MWKSLASSVRRNIVCGVIATTSTSALIHNQSMIAECESSPSPSSSPTSPFVGKQIHQPSFSASSMLQKSRGNVASTRSSEVNLKLDDLCIISGSSHPTFAKKVASALSLPLCEATLSRFSDGEVEIQLNEDIRGRDVVIIQSCAAPVNDSIMELLLTVACARRANARRVIVVIPYFGYKHHRRGNSLSTRHHSRFLWSGAGDFAEMLKQVGVDQVVSVDLQRPGQGSEACFFDNAVPVETVDTTDLFVDHLLNVEKLQHPITVIVPNAECYKKGRKFRNRLQAATNKKVQLLPFLSIDTSSGPTDEAHLVLLSKNKDQVPSVKNGDLVIIDDMVDTAETLSILTSRLEGSGARRVFLCASHGLFSDPGVAARVRASPVTRIITTDSLPLPAALQVESGNKLAQVSVAHRIANVLVTEHLRRLTFAKEEEFEADDDDEDDNTNE